MTDSAMAANIQVTQSAHRTPSARSTSPRTTANFSVVSMFSGCGGMDLGFHGGFWFLNRLYERLPFDIIWANDSNKAACRTYRHNLAVNIHCGDVWHLMETLPAKTDVLIGGFPCQDISVNNGKGLGIRGRRSGLYRAMVEAVDRTRPKVFVAENVKGLLMRHNAPSLCKVLSDFRALNYTLTLGLYQAADYGVPQTRERVFIVGTLPGVEPFSPPPPERSESNWITAHHALADLENVAEDPAINHVWSRANRSPDQGNRRLAAGRPGYTIRAECHGNIQYHYKHPRRISMREAARLQSFPDDFVFHAMLRETERQVGNAVPPVLAWHIARAVKECLATADASTLDTGTSHRRRHFVVTAASGT
jgi:DNA (cytosine-5)-methyltransferase 1